VIRSLLLLTLLSTLLAAQSAPAVKCGFSPHHQGEQLARLTSDRDFDYLEESVLSPQGHFRIHFTRSGDHAVTGSSSPGTPVFILEAGIAADSAYNLIINELGFLPPLSDDGVDGDELDIYVVDMKKNYGVVVYGMTTFASSFPTPYQGLSTYLEIDNDYVESGFATHGLSALRVTIAHEFFHMVQLRYAHPFWPFTTNRYWYEIVSTWMEEKCYPDVNDYHAYVPDNFYKSSFPNLEDHSADFRYSYGHGLFGQILDLEYGTSSGKHIMLDIWEQLGEREATANLEMVLESSRWNSSLTDALGKYALYNVFTGSRAIQGQYYEDAQLLPEIRTDNEILPTDLPHTHEVLIEPRQMRYKRFISNTTQRIYLLGEDLTPDQRVYLTKTEVGQESSLKGAVTNTWMSGGNLNPQDYMILPMVNGHASNSATFFLNFSATTSEDAPQIQSIIPNPGNLSLIADGQGVKANVVIPESGKLIVNVFDIRGRMVSSQSEYVEEGVHDVLLKMPPSLPAGLYIAQTMLGNGTSTRKFTVLK